VDRNRLIRDIPPTRTSATSSPRLAASVVAAELGRLTPENGPYLARSQKPRVVVFRPSSTFATGGMPVRAYASDPVPVSL
jgi:hypothetical protein